MDLPPIVGRIVGDNSSFISSLGAAQGAAQASTGQMVGALAAAGIAAAGLGAGLAKLGVDTQTANAIIAVATPLIATFGTTIATRVVPALWSGISAAAAWAVSMVQAGVAAVSAAMPVIVAWAPVILTIAAIGAAAYLLWRNWDTVWGFIKDAASTAAAWIGDHLTWIAAAVLLPIAPLVVLVGAFVRNWDTISGAVGAAASWIGDRIDDVVGFFSALPGRILGALGDIGGLLFGAGRDLIMGMVNGVKSMAGALLSAAKSVVSGAVNSVKSFLGIGSPSKVFMGIGQDTIAGLVQGIEGGRGAVSSSFAGLGQTVVGAGRGLPMGGGAAPPQVIQLVCDGKVLAEVVRDNALDLARHDGTFG